MAKRKEKKRTGAILPPWQDVLNNQVWRLRQRVNLLRWLVVGLLAVLVVVAAWGVLR